MWHTPTGNRVLGELEAELIRDALDGIVDQLLASDRSCDDCLFESGIEVFDSLPIPQKLALIEQVARYLLTETSDPLPLTAVNESVVGAIFEHIRQQIELEIDSDEDPCDESPWSEFDEESLLADDPPSSDQWRAEDTSFRRTSWDRNFADLGDTDAAGRIAATSWRDRLLQTGLAVLNALENTELFDGDFQWPAPDSQDMQQWDWLIESLADRILWDRDYEMAEAFLDEDPASATARKSMLGIDLDYFTGLAPDPRDDCLQQVVVSLRDLTRAKPR